MSLIGVINSDPDLQARIEKAFSRDSARGFMLHTAASTDSASDLLNFDLPEIVILNASDPVLSAETLARDIHSDAWLHNFGIIALYDKKNSTEKNITALFKDINLLALMDYGSIASNLLKNVAIIEKNRQIIFQWEMMNTLPGRITGSFVIDNDPMSVPVYAGLAANALVQRGFLGQDKKRSLQIALAELVQNGIEHGNCSLSFDEKTKFLLEGNSIAELIAEKCRDPEVAARRVHLEWDIQKERTKFYIRDQGQGFDVMEYQRKMKGRSRDELHGRGILLAQSFGGKLSYNRQGNVACLTVEHQTAAPRQSPVGFAGEEILLPQPGDIIFNQGEVSDFIYYISSGEFAVYHDDHMIGRLGPAEIFMGEMSFLLNNVRTATIRAVTQGKIIKISRKSFVSSIRRYPHYSLFLAKLLARKLSMNNKSRFKHQESRELTT